MCNHPRSILRNIPEGINRTLSNISSDEQVFDSAVPTCQEALKKSGYDHQLRFNQTPPRTKRKRSRNVTWYNSPYSANVATNIGRKFLHIVDTGFPVGNPLRKIFNRNTLKSSYSGMPNMQAIITSHNKAVLAKTNKSESTTTQKKTCNCRKTELKAAHCSGNV